MTNRERIDAMHEETLAQLAVIGKMWKSADYLRVAIESVRRHPDVDTTQTACLTNRVYAHAKRNITLYVEHDTQKAEALLDDLWDAVVVMCDEGTTPL